MGQSPYSLLAGPGPERKFEALPTRRSPLPLILSTEDVVRLQSALTTLLSPLDSPTLDGWRSAAMNAAQARDDEAVGASSVLDRQKGELLRLLLPAFKAGLHTRARLARRRADLFRMLDILDTPLQLFDMRGKSLHQNAALGELLAQEPEADRVRNEVSGVARALSLVVRRQASDTETLCRAVRTTGAGYRLTGTALGQVLGTEQTIGVGVERLRLEYAPDSVLSDRYRLTRRESQVARCLAAGDSSAKIAAVLCISRYTARHHTESVMRKLDVRSRAAVAGRIMSL